MAHRERALADRLVEFLRLIRDYQGKRHIARIQGDLIIGSPIEQRSEFGRQAVDAGREKNIARAEIREASLPLADAIEATGRDGSVVYAIHQHCDEPYAYGSDWERWVVELRRLVASLGGATAPVMRVDTRQNVVEHEGSTHTVTPDTAALLAAIVEADGEWIVGGNYNSTPSRLADKLPEPVRDCIESAPGKGYRLRK